MLHNITGNVSILWQGVAVNGLGLGKRLQAEFADEAVRGGTIPLKGLPAVPHIPEVGVSPAGVIKNFTVIIGRVRATRPVVALGVKSLYYIGQELIEKPGVIAPAHLTLVPLIAYPSLLNFIVTAPEGDARVMAESVDVVLRLSTDILHKDVIKGGVGCAGEHEILPNADAEFIAEVVEYVSLVDTATPDAKHVHVCPGCAFKEMNVIIICEMWCERVGRNPVSTFGKEWDIINSKLE
ncbi:hypothetical protein ES703_120195 [subsurface metagenome]